MVVYAYTVKLRKAKKESEPEGSRFGLEMTHKLLAGVEKQIADLSK